MPPSSSPRPSPKLPFPATNIHTPSKHCPPPRPPPPLMNIPPPPPRGSGLDSAPLPPPLGLDTAPLPPTQTDPRSALMDAIKGRSQLKSVDPASIKPTPTTDSRGDLLAKIRQGVNLKTVEPQAEKEKPKETYYYNLCLT
uniref:WH2 domain-containing protein n=1 Tax=Cacopsylla melanoneura TaxID=428564 RepID=A0A8D9DQN2_9HEMI